MFGNINSTEGLVKSLAYVSDSVIKDEPTKGAIVFDAKQKKWEVIRFFGEAGDRREKGWSKVLKCIDGIQDTVLKKELMVQAAIIESSFSSTKRAKLAVQRMCQKEGCPCPLFSIFCSRVPQMSVNASQVESLIPLWRKEKEVIDAYEHIERLMGMLTCKLASSIVYAEGDFQELGIYVKNLKEQIEGLLSECQGKEKELSQVVSQVDFQKLDKLRLIANEGGIDKILETLKTVAEVRKDPSRYSEAYSLIETLEKMVKGLQPLAGAPFLKAIQMLKEDSKNRTLKYSVEQKNLR